MVRNAHAFVVQHFLAAPSPGNAPTIQMPTSGHGTIFGQGITLNLAATIGTISFWLMCVCILGFILGAALYAFSTRNSQSQFRSHEATRLILGSLIGVMLFGGLNTIVGLAFNAGTHI